MLPPHVLHERRLPAKPSFLIILFSYRTLRRAIQSKQGVTATTGIQGTTVPKGCAQQEMILEAGARSPKSRMSREFCLFYLSCFRAKSTPFACRHCCEGITYWLAPGAEQIRNDFTLRRCYKPLLGVQCFFFVYIQMPGHEWNVHAHVPTGRDRTHPDRRHKVCNE